MAASPCPIPDVSTITRSKRAALQAAITSGSAWEISDPASRVASERMNTFGWLIAFMRMRSPSSAPPDLRRDGSIEITAIDSASCWSSRKRRISSSVSDDLPAPPVPVMPSTGVVAVFAWAWRVSTSAGSARPFSSAVISWASARRSPPARASSEVGA
ncbi:hypothetical protein D3C81_1501770 [compost metagenome]